MNAPTTATSTTEVSNQATTTAPHLADMKNLLGAVKSSAVLGWYIAHDGLALDDAWKLLQMIPEVNEIAEKVRRVPLVWSNIMHLTLRDIAVLNRYQAEVFSDALVSIEKINRTGTYKALSKSALAGTKSNKREILGIEHTKELFAALKASTILGWYIAYDGLSVNDAWKLLQEIPTISAIAEKIKNAPLAWQELGDLTIGELAELNQYQAQMFEEVVVAIENINATGAYKTLKA